MGGLEPVAVAVGDLDGDGDLDSVDAEVDYDLVVVNRNNGRRGLQPQGYYQVGTGPVSVALGDLNGDGRLDIVSANNNASTLSVLLNQGDGTFGPAQSFSSGVGEDPASVVLGDLDGDGDLDAVVANQAGSIAVLPNDGSGNFPTYTLTAVSQATAVDLGDLDGDGDLDALATRSSYSDSVALLLNDGSGGLSYEYSFSGAPYARFLAVGDLDADSRLDVVTCGNYEDVFVNFNRGGFTDPYAFYAAYPQDVALGDMNGDGNPDIVTASYRFDYYDVVMDVALLLGDGTGDFAQAQLFYTGLSPRSVALGDGDGDGRLDAFTADAGSATVSVLYNRGDGTLEEGTFYDAGADSERLAAGDLDGDGDLDLAVANSDSYYCYLLLNQGDGTFVVETTTELVDDDYANVAIGDVDGDGDADLVLTQDNDPSGVTLFNDGGTFSSYTGFNVLYSSESVALGDLDDDGELDLVAASPTDYGPGVIVARGQGDGTFTDPALYDVGAYQDTRQAVLGDLDGDGDLDIAAASASPYQAGYGVAVLLNDGNGQFGAAQTFYSGYYNQGLALGDLDGDGDLDLAVCAYGRNGFTGYVYTLLGDGSGNLTPAYYQVCGQRPRSIALGDFDGQDSLDAVTVNRGSADTSILLGVGNGAFQAPFGMGMCSSDPFDVVVGDLNGDGRLDFAATDSDGTRGYYTYTGERDVYVFLQR
jgi:hypothetical protein